MDILNYWKELLLPFGFLISFFAGKRTRKIQEKKDGADAIAALQSVYDKYIEHNKTITEDLLSRVKSLEEHNKDLQKNFNDMSFSYAILMSENKKLERDYATLKEAHEKLQKEFEEYRKKHAITKK